MKILDRYLVRNFIWPLCFCFCLFLFMFIFIDSLNNLDEFLKHDAPFQLILTYYGLLVPMVAGEIIPASVLLASLYFIGQMNRHNEISAMKASGVSSAQILAPILLTGLLLSTLVMAMNECWLPHAAVLSASIKKNMLDDEGSGSTKSLINVTLITKGNRMIFARELRLDTRTLYEIIVLEHGKDLTVKAKVTAKSATYEKGRWVFYETVRYEFDERGDLTNEPKLIDKQITDIREEPMDFVRQDTQTHFMNFRQLREHIRNTGEAGKKTSARLLVDLHNKMASPFASLVILLAGAPVAMRIRRGGPWISLGMGLLIVAVYYASNAVSMALGKGGALPAVMSVWAPQFLFAAFGLRFLRRHG